MFAPGAPASDRNGLSEGAGAVIHRAPDTQQLEFEADPSAATADQAAAELSEFEQKWTKYPAMGKLWREHWDRLIPYFSLITTAGAPECVTAQELDRVHVPSRGQSVVNR